MAAIHEVLKVGLACAVVTAGVAISAGISFAAEQATAEDIIRALKPVPKLTTRSLTATRANDEDSQFVESLRNRTTRSLSTTERDKIATAIEKKPSIDLEINFDFNSDHIASSAAPQVSALGQALTSPELQGGTFVVAGYTDGKGGDSFNQGLSERRADAVKRYLAEKYHIAVANLVTVGYGRTRLKNTTNPLAAENRRVQVVNMADK